MDPMAANEADGTKKWDRRRLQVRGIVQGVGFRPLVFRIAVENQVTGYVCNQLGEVTIEVERSTGTGCSVYWGITGTNGGTSKD